MLKKLKQADTKRGDMVKAKSPAFAKGKNLSIYDSKKNQNAQVVDNKRGKFHIKEPISYTSVDEKELRSLINKDEKTISDNFNNGTEIFYTFADTGNEWKDTYFKLFALLLVCLILAGSFLLLSKYGKISPDYFERALNYKNTIQEYVISKSGKIKKLFLEKIHLQGDKLAKNQAFMLLNDFNNKKTSEEYFSARNCSVSFIPRIRDSEGDYALHIENKETNIPNTVASISLNVNDIIIGQYSHVEFWMESETFGESPLNIAIFLHSGSSTVKYQFVADADNWRRYSIPLTEFGGVGYFSSISKISFVIHPTDNENFIWGVNIDDLYLTKKS